MIFADMIPPFAGFFPFHPFHWSLHLRPLCLSLSLSISHTSSFSLCSLLSLLSARTDRRALAVGRRRRARQRAGRRTQCLARVGPRRVRRRGGGRHPFRVWLDAGVQGRGRGEAVHV